MFHDNYVATRVIPAIYEGYVVQAQKKEDYNWVSINHFSEANKNKAIIAASNLAKDISLHVKGLVTAYVGSYEHRSYLNGAIYTK